MRKRLRSGIGVGFGVLLAVLTVAYVVLLRLPTKAEHCGPFLDLPALRALAASMPGDKPSEIRVEAVGSIELPRPVVYAGAPWGSVEFVLYAYQIVLPDRSILVDTALDEAHGKQMGAGKVDAAAWERVHRLLGTASAVYITHEHGDHLGGVASAGDLPDLQRIKLTPEQRAHLDGMKPLSMPEDVAGKLGTIEYSGAVAVGPGVVLLKAPGHTPGSQVVFVQLANGREVFLLGDLAWQTENLETGQTPPRITRLFGANDRAEHACELEAFRQLRMRAPAVRLVAGHDRRIVDALVRDGTLVERFR